MNTKRNISNILFIAFILRLILLIINNYIFILPQGGGDALAFEENAYLLSISNEHNDIWYYLSSGSNLFSLLGSFVYSVIGRQPFFLGLIMVVLGVYTVKLVFKASLLVWQNVKIAKKAAWITALFPVLILHSALYLREVPVNVLLLLAIISFIKFWKYNEKSKLIWFVFYVILATLFHSGSILLLIGLALIVLISSKNSNFIKRFGIFMMVIITIFIINSTGFGLTKIGGSFENSVELFQERENYELRGGSAFPEYLMLSGGVTDFIKIPFRYIAFLFSPFIPFLVRSFSHILGLIDAFLYLYMFYIFLKRRTVFKQNNTAKNILILGLVLVFAFSLGTSNVGTAIRHRAKMAPLFIIVFVGLNKQRFKNVNYSFNKLNI